MGLLSLFCSSAHVVTQRKVGTPQNDVTTLPVQSRLTMATSHPHWRWLRVLKHHPTQTEQEEEDEEVQQALRAWPAPPHKLPRPVPRAAEAPQAPQPPGSSCPAAREAQLPQPRPRHRQPHRGNDVHRNSTYSGSLLHNNRHLTQGSPDFTDSKKGERGREDSAGKGSQRDGGDRARPALVTGVQNGPELQLQVWLNIFRADTISPLPTPCLVWLDPLRPPSSPSLPKSPQEPPWAWGGQGSHSSIAGSKQLQP